MLKRLKVRIPEGVGYVLCTRYLSIIRTTSMSVILHVFVRGCIINDGHVACS